jgi:hypothetical protein
VLDLSAALFVVAALANAAAAALNIWQSRRLRRTALANAAVLAAFPRLLGFAAFVSRPESGAPVKLQIVARDVLPLGVSIVVETGTETRH